MEIIAMTMVVSSDVKNEKNLRKFQNFCNLVKYRKLMHNNIQPPSVNIVFAEILITKYMRMRYGNCTYFNQEDSAQQEDADMDHILNFIQNNFYLNDDGL